jgi:hypothetical protein
MMGAPPSMPTDPLAAAPMWLWALLAVLAAAGLFAMGWMAAHGFSRSPPQHRCCFRRGKDWEPPPEPPIPPMAPLARPAGSGLHRTPKLPDQPRS